MYWPSKHPTYTYVAPPIERRLGISASEFTVADVVRAVVELGIEVSTGREDAVPDVRPVKVDETGLPSPEVDPIAVTLAPEANPEVDPVAVTLAPEANPDVDPIAVALAPEGNDVVTGTTISTKLDVRKQTSQC